MTRSGASHTPLVRFVASITTITSHILETISVFCGTVYLFGINPYRHFTHANFRYHWSTRAAWQIDGSYKSTHFFDSNDAIDKERPPAGRKGIGPKQKKSSRRVHVNKAERWIQIGQRPIERQPSERDRNGCFGSLIAPPF